MRVRIIPDKPRERILWHKCHTFPRSQENASPSHFRAIHPPRDVVECNCQNEMTTQRRHGGLVIKG